jgi:hypothetical protein
MDALWAETKKPSDKLVAATAYCNCSDLVNW